MKDQLKRILNLVRRTGDTMIVTDPDGENVFVVMDLDQYESLLDVASNDDIDDLADDLEPQDENFSWIEPTDSIDLSALAKNSPDIWETMKPAGDPGETWDMTNMSESELKNLEDQYKAFAAQSVAEAIAETAKPEAEKMEIPKKDEKEEEFGEEQFYLEPIE